MYISAKHFMLWHNLSNLKPFPNQMLNAKIFLKMCLTHVEFITYLKLSWIETDVIVDIKCYLFGSQTNIIKNCEIIINCNCFCGIFYVFVISFISNVCNQRLWLYVPNFVLTLILIQYEGWSDGKFFNINELNTFSQLKKKWNIKNIKRICVQV